MTFIVLSNQGIGGSKEKDGKPQYTHGLITRLISIHIIIKTATASEIHVNTCVHLTMTFIVLSNQGIGGSKDKDGKPQCTHGLITRLISIHIIIKTATASEINVFTSKDNFLNSSEHDGYQSKRVGTSIIG